MDYFWYFKTSNVYSPKIEIKINQENSELKNVHSKGQRYIVSAYKGYDKSHM